MSEDFDLHGCKSFDEALRWKARPAYDVGEQILIAIRNPWWKFWLPREQKELATVRRVWIGEQEQTVVCVEGAVAKPAESS